MHWQRSGDELLIVGWDVGFPGTARKGGKPDDWTDRDGGVSTCWVCKQQTRIFLMACERERERHPLTPWDRFGAGMLCSLQGT